MFLLFTFCTVQNMKAQLTSLGLVEESNIANVNKDGYMNFIPELSFVDDYLYVATPKGVYRIPYKSQAEWEKLPLTDELVLDFAVRGDTLIVLTRSQLLYSLDGGKTADVYSAADIASEGYNPTLVGMGIHPNNAADIFIVTKGSGLWRTYDIGSGWVEIIGNNKQHVSLTRLFYSPHDTNHLVGLYNNPMIDCAELFFSRDGGIEWKFGAGEYMPRNISQALSIAFHPTNVNNVVACGHSLYAISDDGGASWSAITEPNGRDCVANITDVQFDLRNSDVLYGADWFISKKNTTTVLRSTDGGYTWETFFSESIAPNAHVLSFDMKDNLLALYTFSGGIYLLDVDAVEASISTVQTDVTTTYYDLMGRPVAHPTRGIYIKEGKKVVIGQ